MEATTILTRGGCKVPGFGIWPHEDFALIVLNGRNDAPCARFGFGVDVVREVAPDGVAFRPQSGSSGLRSHGHKAFIGFL